MPKMSELLAPVNNSSVRHAGVVLKFAQLLGVSHDKAEALLANAGEKRVFVRGGFAIMRTQRTVRFMTRKFGWCVVVNDGELDIIDGGELKAALKRREERKRAEKRKIAKIRAEIRAEKLEIAEVRTEYRQRKRAERIFDDCKGARTRKRVSGHGKSTVDETPRKPTCFVIKEIR